MDQKFEVFFARFIDALKNFPTREEVFGENSPIATKEDIAEVKQDINQVKDHIVALEEKVEIQNTFLGGRVDRLETTVFGKSLAFNDSAKPN